MGYIFTRNINVCIPTGTRSLAPSSQQMADCKHYGIKSMKYLLPLGLACLLCPTLGHAQALRFQPQGAVAAGQGNAFAAQADDASAIHYNPAGLSQVNGVQVVTGTTLLGGSIKTNNSTGIDSRGDFGGSVAFPPPSHSYVSANLGSLGRDEIGRAHV